MNTHSASLCTSIGIGIVYWYQQDQIILGIGYWVTCLVSF